MATSQNFELVSEEDIQEYYEKPVFVPDSRITGTFQLLNTALSEQTADEPPMYFRQKFTLNFASEVDRDASLVVGLTSGQYDVGQGEGSYSAHTPEERQRQKTTGSGELGVIFDQAYLQFFSNPCNGFKIGLQHLVVGDNEGLIFRGRNWAIRNQCTIGTWPYDIGFARIGDDRNDSIKWGRITYPVYNNGNFETNNNLAEKYAQSSLEFDFLRVIYNEYKIPLARNGQQTWVPASESSVDHSPFHVQYDDGKYVYHSIRNNYYGMILRWNYYGFRTEFSFLGLEEDLDYYAGLESGLYGSNVEREDITSSGSNFARFYKWKNEFYPSQKIHLFLDAMYSDGNSAVLEDLDDPSHDVLTDFRHWEHGNSSFRGISSGTYENRGKIYFNAVNGDGYGHSISNLLYYGGGFNYTNDKKTYLIGMNLYNYERVQEVYNAERDLVKRIGWEAAFLYEYYYKTRLKFELFGAYFKTDEAYTRNDNITPDSNDYEPSFFHTGIGIKYEF